MCVCVTGYCKEWWCVFVCSQLAKTAAIVYMSSQCNVCIQLGERERETILHVQERMKEGERVKMKHIHVPYLILGSESVRLSS